MHTYLLTYLHADIAIVKNYLGLILVFLAI